MDKNYLKKAGAALCALLLVGVAGGGGTASAQAYYKKVTSQDDIVDGGIYVMMTSYTSNWSGTTYGVVGKKNSSVYTGNALTKIEAFPETSYTNATIAKLGDGTDGSAYTAATALEFAFHQTGDEGTKYMIRSCEGWLGFSNYQWQYYQTKPEAGDASAEWVITANGNGSFNIALISTTSATGYSYLCTTNGTNMNVSTSSSAQKDIQLYRKMVPLTFAPAAEGWATYFTENAYAMPTDVTGYAVNSVPTDGSGYVEPTTAYEAQATVPARTPLLLRTAAPTETQTLDVPALDLDATPSASLDGNLLQGILEPGTVGAPDGGEATDYAFYKLTTKEGTDIGFYYGADGGGTFDITGHNRAYLAVEKSRTAGIQGFRLGGNGTETGLAAAEASAAPRAEAVYTLSGLRLDTPANRLPAGIYIVNGKKVIVR